MYRLMEKNLRKRGDFKLTRRLYLALTEHVTQVVSNKPQGIHDSLIDAVFSFDFVIKDMTPQEFVDAEILRDAFATCALSFVSAKATLAPSCLRMLIRSLQQLAYSSGTIQCDISTSSTSENASSGTGIHDDSKVELALRVRIVNLILRVVKLVPTAGASLVGPLLAEHFPHRFRHVQCLRCYARGVLEVARELPRISSDLVALLVEKCLEIDVEIKLDDNGAAKLTGSAAGGGGGKDESGEESEGEDDDINLLGFGSPIAINSGRIVNYIGVTPSASSTDALKKDLPAPVAVDEMAEKLDMLMLELFEHIDMAMAVVSTREADNRRSKDEIARLWNAIHGTFLAKILLTHRSKFVQFLLLRFCALQPDYALMFANGLENMCVDRMVPHVRRINAVHFLASFAVRSTALPLTATAAVVTRLLNWAVAQLPSEEEQHKLRAQNKTMSKDIRGQANIAAGLLDPSDLTNHRLGVLYSISQALFYIMCFKASAFSLLLHSQDSEKAALTELMVGSTWSRLCNSPLQPLAYCLERVRVEFLTTTRRLKLLPREESYGLQLKSEEALRALSTLAGLDLTHFTPRSERKNPVTPRAAAESSSSSPDRPPRTPGAGGGGGKEVWSAPIRTPGSSLSSAVTPKSKQTPTSAAVSSVSGAGEFNKTNPLDSFFPFDPYLLRNSFCFVSDIYCEWEPCYEEDDEDDAERDNHELSDGSVKTDDTSAGDSETESDDDSDAASFNMDVSRSDGSVLGTSLGSQSLMSVDSAPASPLDLNPSPLAQLDASRQAQDVFQADEDEDSDEYERDYRRAGARRVRAESIGDW
jgi:RNA polymerase I-specific transcription initiation factor RRN3